MTSLPKWENFDAVRVGDSYTINRCINEQVVDRFAHLSGDFNPLHMDVDYARGSGFVRRVAHGAILSGYVSTLIGMHLPGPGALWMTQSFEWRQPVLVGDTVDIEVKVVQKSVSTRTLGIEVRAVNQNGEIVLEGKGAVMVMEEKRKSGVQADVHPGAALVTGASRGIGAAIALKLAEIGIPVAVNYVRNRDAADAVCAAITKRGGRAVACPADVTDEDAVRVALDRVRAEWNIPIGILVNNASGPIEERSFSDITWASIQSHLDIQVRGAFHLCKAVVPAMIDRRSGTIINIGSSVSIGSPPSRWSGYVIAKHALRGLTRSLAQELGPHGITVNMVSPGLTVTDLTSGVSLRQKKVFEAQNPLRRLCSVNDVANVVAFLAGPSAAFLNGVDMPVTGGQLML